MVLVLRASGLESEYIPPLPEPGCKSVPWQLTRPENDSDSSAGLTQQQWTAFVDSLHTSVPLGSVTFKSLPLLLTVGLVFLLCAAVLPYPTARIALGALACLIFFAVFAWRWTATSRFDAAVERFAKSEAKIARELKTGVTVMVKNSQEVKRVPIKGNVIVTWKWLELAVASRSAQATHVEAFASDTVV